VAQPFAPQREPSHRRAFPRTLTIPCSRSTSPKRNAQTSVARRPVSKSTQRIARLRAVACSASTPVSFGGRQAKSNCSHSSGSSGGNKRFSIWGRGRRAKGVAERYR
jgi:hypothetical protein